MVRPRPRGRRDPGLKPDSAEDPTCMGLLHVKSYVVGKRLPSGVVRKFRKGVPAQVSSSPSDRGSKSRSRPKIALLLLQN
ncbi:hypothetical protein AVEN_120781-1, partial [Araneus ventricosus]